MASHASSLLADRPTVSRLHVTGGADLNRGGGPTVGASVHPARELDWHERMSALDVAIDADSFATDAPRSLVPGFALLAAGNTAALSLMTFLVVFLTH